ncbi:MAG: type IV pilus secretin PilQ [Deltaproteobacteria bacterium]|nr:type IV pilus secretin PilQ [Deltaproteobacteria bacterium]
MDLKPGRALVGVLYLLLSILSFLISGCSTSPEIKSDGEDKTRAAAVIESVRTEATPDQAVITFVCSKSTTHGDPLTLSNPARIHFDINGIPSEELRGNAIRLKAGPVKEILIGEKKGAKANVMVYLRHDENQARLIHRGNDIVLQIFQVSKKEAEPEVAAPGEKPDPSLARIVDVSVHQRKGKRTRLLIRADRTVEYDVKLEDRVLIITIKQGTMGRDLMKKLDAGHYDGVVKDIRAFYSPLDKETLLRVRLAQLIPYHITRNGKILNVDFDPLPEARPRPTEQTKRQAPPGGKPGPDRDVSKDRAAELLSRASRFEATSKQYAGQRMSFDFVDTDIRNILTLIAEVAGINIVWGSDVEGKISMKLDNIPWDQALEMILRPNGLTYQIEDDVLWVVPRERLRDLEIKEGKRKGALMASKRLQGIFEAKIIEFITIRNRKASDIFRMLVGDPNADPPIRPALDIEAAESEEEEEGEEEKGKKVKIATLDLYLSYDPGTNMIIANGVRAKVDKVKELIAKLDIPEKQVMIEARVVDAQTSFARDLGIQWRSLDGTNPGISGDWHNTGTTSWGSGQFSTNAPSGWSPTIGLALGWLTGGGLGSIALDASLALGEEEGKVRVISAPKVLTVNGGEAVISRGEVTYQPIVSLDTVDVKEMTATLSLTVKPTISADNSHVTMVVKVTDDKQLPAEVRVDPVTGDKTESQPGKTEKTVETTLMVRTGDTVVIGGIYHKQEQTVDSGVPWLMDIPIVGWLFKAQHKTYVKTELLIFLTPTVVDPLKNREGV